MPGILRRAAAVSILAALAACAGAVHELPEVSEAARKSALGEIDAAPDLTPSGRTAEENEQLVYALVSDLQSAAMPICRQAGRENCWFDVDFVRDAEINAFASERNKITFHNGLAKYLAGEDEVAAVLAHEMGHHIADHIAKAQGNAVVGGLIAGLVFGGLVSATGGYYDPYQYQYDMENAMELGAQLGDVSFSKEHEREADYIGAYILARAGHDLAAARTVWVKIAKSSDHMEAALFDTHPAGPERLAAWDMTVAEIEASDDLLPEMRGTTPVGAAPGDPADGETADGGDGWLDFGKMFQ